MKLTLSQIASKCGGTLHSNSNGERYVTSVFTDSRKLCEDGIYAAIRGETVDGNKFAPSVVLVGGCALVDNEEYFCADTVLVSDVRSALRDLASAYRREEMAGMTVIGVTGSVGKTTTKDMISHALSVSKNVHKTQGNANSQVGLPITVLDTPADAEIAVLELGMSYPGEMDRIASVARPHVSVVTNIGYSHIENLGSREAIRDEKLLIAAHSSPDSMLLLNGDEPLLREYCGEKKAYFISLSDPSCHCYADNIVTEENRLLFDAVIFGKKLQVVLNVIGDHYVSNALFALGCAYLTDVDIELAASALSTYKSDGKRLFVYKTSGRTVISDCYNASPESMKAALSVLQKTESKRKIAVLGDMLELGAESDRLHRLVGEYVSMAADVLVTYGTQAKKYASYMGDKPVFSFEKGEMTELKEFLGDFLSPGDAVLYKASNGMRLTDAVI